MALIYCPECGHEISNSAVACPNCGRPLNTRPVIERNVAAAPERSSGFPAWAMIPLVLLGGLVLVLLFMLIGRDDGTEEEMAINVNTRPPATSRGPLSQPDTTTSSGTISTAPPAVDQQEITIPGSQTGVSQPQPTTGKVVIDARVISREGKPEAVANEKFYLLDEDLESILRDADIEPIAGQSLVNSFGLSVLHPERFGEFNRAALRAINEHIKYSAMTGRDGKTELEGIEPDRYHLFGITKTGGGFAIWSSPVSITAGDNVLNLSPQRVTEIKIPPGV